MFEQAGYVVGLIYERNTSKKSFVNGSTTEKFRKRENPRPNKKDIRQWHGLLRFKCVTNNESARHILVNRDFNGSMNIRKKAICHLNNEPIPKYFK